MYRWGVERATNGMTTEEIKTFACYLGNKR